MTDAINIDDLFADRTSFPQVTNYTDTNSIFTRFTAIVPADEYSDDTVLQLPWFDPLDERLVKILTSISGYSSYTYKGEAFTTISNNVYGTTSRWWIILWVNGYFHPDEVARGTVLQIPTFNTSLVTATTPTSSTVGAGSKVTV